MSGGVFSSKDEAFENHNLKTNKINLKNINLLKLSTNNMMTIIL